MSDPSLHARHRELKQMRQKDSLSRAIKNRRSAEELMKANIIKGARWESMGHGGFSKCVCVWGGGGGVSAGNALVLSTHACG